MYVVFDCLTKYEDELFITDQFRETIFSSSHTFIKTRFPKKQRYTIMREQLVKIVISAKMSS